MPKEFLTRYLSKIREINAKYRTPRIQMSKPVRVCLFVLRLYLLTLVLLLMYKFVAVIAG